MAENEHGGRIRWGRWIGGGLTALIVALLVGHMIWGSVTAGRLQRQIKAAQDAGEPVLPADFAVSNVDSPDNAGPDILAAAGLLDESTPEWKRYYDVREPFGVPLRDDERQIIVGIVPQLIPAFERLEKARGKTRFDWDMDLTSPMLGKLIPGLNDIRSLVMALQMQAMLDHDQSRHRAAADRVEQMVLVSRYPDHYPSLVGHLVSNGCFAATSSLVIDIAADLRIGQGSDEVTPEQVRRLIDLLLDEPSATAGFVRSLRGERMSQLDSINCMANGVAMGGASGAPGTAWHPLVRYFAKPVLYRNASTMFSHMSGMIAAADAKSWPDFQAAAPPVTESGSKLDLFSDILLPSLGRSGETQYRVMTDRRLAAVALAVRWYVVEHNGQVPLRFDDLVPKYLPAVPIDPLAAGGKLLSYLPGAGKPIAWSVGINAMDESGSELGTNPKRPARHEWEMQDRVVPLYRRPRPEPMPALEP